MDFFQVALEHAASRRPGGSDEAADPAMMLERMRRAFLEKGAARAAEIATDVAQQEVILGALAEEIAADAEPPADWQFPEGAGQDAAPSGVGADDASGSDDDEEAASENLARVLAQPKWVL